MKDKAELLAKYNGAFAIVMAEQEYSKQDRHDSAIRAATLAEVLGDRQRLTHALFAAAQTLR